MGGGVSKATKCFLLISRQQMPEGSFSVESRTLVIKNTSCLPGLLVPSLGVTAGYRACITLLVTELVCYCWLLSLCVTAGY